MATATTIAIIDTFTKLRKLARTIDKVNEDAKEHGIYPDKNTEDKIQTATENAQAYLWCEPGNPQILFGNNKGIQRIKEYKKAVSIQRPPFLYALHSFDLYGWHVLKGRV